MKKGLAVVVALGGGLGLVRLFDGAPEWAEAGTNPLPSCQDINGDGSSDISDAIYFLQWRFLGGPRPTCPDTGGEPAGLPDTGQEVCYDSAGGTIDCANATCPGQDGRYATGCSSDGRFTDNGNGTVTDHCTGLMWQKDTADVNEDGALTGQDATHWCRALAYCEDLSFAGHDDWRLPNVRELQSIVDYGRKGGAVTPAIDPVFGAFSGSYWSSTSNFSGPIGAWYVDFFLGRVQSNFKNFNADVRAVRRGPRTEAQGRIPLPPCQDINGDGSSDVSDAIYFLQWRFLGGPRPACPTTSEVPAGVPDTGQAICYDGAGGVIDCASAACPGQDGRYATGCPSEGRFTDNEDGTVTDHCTGLMWQKETADSGVKRRWCEALVYCENLSFAGHDDWRLPGVRELESIVDYGSDGLAGPVIEPVFSTSSAAYWSSTSSPVQPGSAWHVDFHFGGVQLFSKVATNYFRAVRSGP